MTMTAPIDHIRRLGQEDIAKGRMTAVGGAGEHQVLAVDLAGEEHRVAVEGNKWVLHPDKGLKVLSLRQADGCAVKIGAPHDIVGILHLDQAGIVGIAGHEGLALFIDKGNAVFVNGPMDRVLRIAHVDVGDAVHLFAAQHCDKAVLIRRDGAVEDAGDALDGIAIDHGVAAVTPDGGIDRRGGLFLPGDVGQRGSGQYFRHRQTLLFL